MLRLLCTVWTPGADGWGNQTVLKRHVFTVETSTRHQGRLNKLHFHHRDRELCQLGPSSGCSTTWESLSVTVATELRTQQTHAARWLLQDPVFT